KLGVAGRGRPRAEIRIAGEGLGVDSGRQQAQARTWLIQLQAYACEQLARLEIVRGLGDDLGELRLRLQKVAARQLSRPECHACRNEIRRRRGGALQVGDALEIVATRQLDACSEQMSDRGGRSQFGEQSLTLRALRNLSLGEARLGERRKRECTLGERRRTGHPLPGEQQRLLSQRVLAAV